MDFNKYNEKEYALKIKEHGYQTKYQDTELYLLAKYYRLEEKRQYKEIERLLYEFCNKYEYNFNKVLSFRRIDKAINKVKKNKNFINVESIKITKNELEYIDNLNLEYDYKKIIFTLMVQNKIFHKIHLDRQRDFERRNYIPHTSVSLRNIISASKVKSNMKWRDVVYKLCCEGLIEPILVSGNLKLLFLDNIEDCEEVVIVVEDFNNIGLYLDLFYGLAIKCMNCNKLSKKRTNNQIYCSECRRYKKLETKTIKCIDCEKEFIVDGLVKNKTRCNDCQKQRRKEQVKTNVAKHRNKNL